MMTSTPRPSVNLMMSSTASVSRGADDVVGLDDRGGLLEPVAVELDQGHAGGAPGPGQPDVQAADRAGPDDDDVVARTDPGQLLAR